MKNIYFIFLVGIIISCKNKTKNEQQTIDETATVSDSIIKSTNKIIIDKTVQWNPFWESFTTAINSKNATSIKELMCSDKYFQYNTGQTKDEWIKENFTNNDLYKELLKSMNSGTKKDGTNSKITNDDWLIFEYKNNKWQFVGIMSGC